jgi:hypothetical protein
MGGGRNMPLLTELENVLGCVSTEISPRTGLGAARRGRRDGRRPGWFLLDKIFRGRKVKFVKRKTTPKIL